MSVTVEQVNDLYEQFLGRSGQEEYLQNWAQTGGTLQDIRNGIISSPEGQLYQAQLASDGPIGGGKQTPITPTVTTEQVSDLYQELLGRPGQDRFLQNWAQNGGTLDQIRAGIAGSPEGIAYAAAQGGGGDQVGGGTTGGGTTDAGGIPDWFSSYTDQLSAMQAEIAALNALLTEQQAGGGSSSVGSVGVPGGVPPAVGVPGGGTPVTSSGSSYTMPTVAPPMDNPYLAQLPTNPPVGYIPPTPEMLDAYRYEQFYNQGMIPPVDQGIGGLSYFGIPPSQIQASLTGF